LNHGCCKLQWELSSLLCVHWLPAYRAFQNRNRAGTRVSLFEFWFQRSSRFFRVAKSLRVQRSTTNGKIARSPFEKEGCLWSPVCI
jgi:hypothetical protein